MRNVIQYTFLVLILTFCYSAALFARSPKAQQLRVSGTVTSLMTGEALTGVNVLVKGKGVGTITDREGKYSVEVPSDNAILVFSFIGYTTEEVELNGNMEVDMQLAENIEALSEIVVTALGMERETKALGYSVTEVQGNEITQAREMNMINSLKGRVAGLNISQSATGAGGSSRIIIRGASSLREANQPLFVVDGVPIDNTSLRQASRWGGFDTGSGIADINPDDIESISVLKGPNAAALYGTRAANGVILITTKKGSNKKGLGITVNSNTSFDMPSIDMDYQDIYGRGNAGKFYEFTPTGMPMEPTTSYDSWGPKMEGQNMLAWNGETKPYQKYDNYLDFWKTGRTLANNISVDAGNDRSNVRFSVSNTQNDGIMPNNSLDKTSLLLRVNSKITDKLSIDAKVNYIEQNAYNRPNLADHPDNPMYAFIFMPRSIDLTDLETYRDANGMPVVWDLTPKTRHQNPYWSVNLNINEDKKERLIGFVSMRYDILDWLHFTVRGGTDQYTFRREERTATNTIFERSSESGDKYALTEYIVTERNYDFLFDGNKNISSELALSFTFGGNSLTRQSEVIGYSSNGLNVPDFYNINNGLAVNPVYGFSQKALNSLFGSAQLAYKNYAFLDFTARNDWSSTLPKENWSFFYPSVSASWVITDMVKMNKKLLSFAKVRVSWAKVGNDADPYHLYPGYAISLGHLGQAYGFISPTTKPLTNLKPEITTAIEAGADVRMFDNRIAMDMTVYQKQTINQVLSIPVSKASGWDNKMINAGMIQNKGLELILSVSPISTSNFKWDIGFNFSKNISEVVELADELPSWILGDDKGIKIVASEGRPFGDLIGRAYQRNEEGKIIVGADGLPLKTSRDTLLGNYNPDWMGGIMNTLTYKNISLNFLIDIKMGGEMYSVSRIYAYENGMASQTTEGRDEWYQSEKERNDAGVAPKDWFPTGGYIAEGVVNTGTTDNPVWATNSRPVDPEVYWAHIAAGGNDAIAEQFIYDASFVKFREVSLSYSLPRSLVERTPLSSVSFSVVGRNLFYLMKKTEGFDPEANYSNLNAQGIENCSFPAFRTLGFNINFKF